MITRQQMFEDFAKKVGPASTGARLEEMFIKLSAVDQLTILGEMKNQLVTLYQADVDINQTSKSTSISTFDSIIANLNQKITDIQAVS